MSLAYGRFSHFSGGSFGSSCSFVSGVVSHISVAFGEIN